MQIYSAPKFSSLAKFTERREAILQERQDTREKPVADAHRALLQSEFMDNFMYLDLLQAIKDASESSNCPYSEASTPAYVKLAESFLPDEDDNQLHTGIKKLAEAGLVVCKFPEDKYTTNSVGIAPTGRLLLDYLARYPYQ